MRSVLAVFAMFNLGQAELYGWTEPSNCSAAVRQFKQVSASAGWMLNLPFALDKAHANHVAGFTDVALRQYSALAVLGSSVAQVNAAFLLEQGCGAADFKPTTETSDASLACDGSASDDGACTASVETSRATDDSTAWERWQHAHMRALYEEAATSVRVT